MNASSTYSLRTGRPIPVIGLGTWLLDTKPLETIIEALNLGYRLIDTAPSYGTQKFIGKAIKKSGVPREDVYIVTKVEQDKNAYELAKQNVAEAGLEYVDLTLIVQPPEDGHGAELWMGLQKAKDEGYTKDIGVSNYSIECMKELIHRTGQVPPVNQIEWSPFGYSLRMYEYCRKNRILIMACCPLTHGRKVLEWGTFGLNTYGETPFGASFYDRNTLDELAKEHNRSEAQIMLKWELQMGTLPIPKANQRHHLEENIGVFDFSLTEDEMAIMRNLNEHYSGLHVTPVYIQS